MLNVEEVNASILELVKKEFSNVSELEGLSHLCAITYMKITGGTETPVDHVLLLHTTQLVSELLNTITPAEYEKLGIIVFYISVFNKEAMTLLASINERLLNETSNPVRPGSDVLE